MTKTEAINKLFIKFKMHNITKTHITALIEDALSNGLSVQQAELSVRMALCSELGIEQYYSIEDVMVATGESRENILKMIDEISADMIANGENPLEYFPKVTLQPMC